MRFTGWTREEALNNITEAAEAVLIVRKEQGLPLPTELAEIEVEISE